MSRTLADSERLSALVNGSGSEKPAPRSPEPYTPRTALLQLVLVVLASAVLGGATSFAQTFLPDPLRPFANSASGWTLLTALAVARCRARTIPSAVFGAVSFFALVLGYQIVSEFRGNPTDETLFLLIGVVVGPFIGAAASWLHRDQRRAAVGCGVLAGVAVGEGTFGLILLSEWTGWFYWTVVTLAGLGLLAHTVLRTLRTTRIRVAAVALTVAVGAAFFATYAAVGSYIPDRTDPALRSSASSPASSAAPLALSNQAARS